MAIVFWVRDVSLFLAIIELPHSENLSCIMVLIMSQFKPEPISSLMYLWSWPIEVEMATSR